MRLKNKYFIYNLKKKKCILSSKFFIIHINQNDFFKNIKNFFIENNFFLYKVKNSVYKKFYLKSNPFFFLLKGYTFFLFIENFSDYIEIFRFFDKMKKTKNFYMLGFYEKFLISSFSKNYLFYKKFKNFLFQNNLYLYIFFLLNRFFFRFFNFFKNYYAYSKSINKRY